MYQPTTSIPSTDMGALGLEPHSQRPGHETTLYEPYDRVANLTARPVLQLPQTDNNTLPIVSKHPKPEDSAQTHTYSSKHPAAGDESNPLLPQPEHVHNSPRDQLIIVALRGRRATSRACLAGYPERLVPYSLPGTCNPRGDLRAQLLRLRVVQWMLPPADVAVRTREPPGDVVSVREHHRLDRSQRVPACGDLPDRPRTQLREPQAGGHVQQRHPIA